MYYTVYKITNEINGKIYIGCHKTEDLKDDYMGSGKILKRSIKKYGIENFSKKYLQVFDNPEEMFEMELKLVNDDFITEASNYNIALGGQGGFTLEQCSKGGQSFSRLYKGKTYNEIYGEEKAKEIKRTIRKLGIQKVKDKVGIFSDDYKALPNHWIGKTHTDETKQKMCESKKGHGKGSENSQYGTMWIYNLDLMESKKISKISTIPDGWIKGRKIFK